MDAEVLVNHTENSELEKPQLIKLTIRLVIYVAIIGGFMFGAAGTLRWTMGWAVLLGFFGLVLVSTLAVPIDPELVEERTLLKEDVKSWDKIPTAVMSALFPLALLVVAGFDHRFVWTAPLSLMLQIAALAVATLGYLFSIWAGAVNKFYARYVRIQQERGHTVITDGPYRLVRHPGYAGLLVYLLLAPLALGSWCVYAVSGLMILWLVIRTGLEDRTLRDELPGYEAYTKQTRFRLLPGIW